MAERNDNGETARHLREVKGLLGVKSQDDDAAARVAPLNSLVDGERKTAVRDQVRLMASALGLTVSEADAEAHAATLLALVAAENVSGVGNRAVAAHLLTASARRHEETTERIAVALEALARGKGHDEPAQRVSGAAVKSEPFKFSVGDRVRISTDFPGRHNVDAEEAAGREGVIIEVDPDDLEGITCRVEYVHPQHGELAYWFEGRDLDNLEDAR